MNTASYVSGVSVDELKEGASRHTARVLGQSTLFVKGFAVVFTARGATASAVGAALAD